MIIFCGGPFRGVGRNAVVPRNVAFTHFMYETGDWSACVFGGDFIFWTNDVQVKDKKATAMVRNAFPATHAQMGWPGCGTLEAIRWMADERGVIFDTGRSK